MHEERIAKGERTRRRLLEIATDELATRGELDLARLASRAGVSAGLPYRYYPTKSEWIRALVGSFFDRFDAQVFDAHFSGETWTARERARTEAFVRFFLTEPLAPFVSAVSSDASVAAGQRDRVAQQIKRAAKNVRAGQRLGEVDAELDPELAATVLIGGMVQAINRALLGEMKRSRAKLTEQVWRVVVNLLRLREP
ncbi:TetR/AcrR family transcriptional regulator [Sandaracinus amylolyticus]|uniref:Transcriptional regulator, TetR family protein n=1 Tax=Sandaracinus amylolyticus TaxID=927083 RepID=A0A0F6YNM4_9BACT|nr:TetR/AcrR family transcriptional regulator [Sandaracinus amylolyticus]AKF11682.1 Transcriptional regulator, TetR family protein [Sandaracinus amylolyticus]